MQCTVVVQWSCWRECVLSGSWRHILHHSEERVSKDPFAWPRMEAVIREKNLTGWEMIHFNLTSQVPRTTVIYLNFCNILDEEEEQKEDALEATMLVQTCNLTDHGKKAISWKFYRHSMHASSWHLWPSCQAQISIETLLYVSFNLYVLFLLLSCPCINILWWRHFFDIAFFLLAY
jgi:hypothetical protein